MCATKPLNFAPRFEDLFHKVTDLVPYGEDAYRDHNKSPSEVVLGESSLLSIYVWLLLLLGEIVCILQFSRPSR